MKLLSLLLLGGLVSAAASQFAAAAGPSTPRFETDVRPIFKAHCWQCHGEVDELKGKLDTRLVRFLLKGGESGPAIVPGMHEASLLYVRVDSGEMPPGSKRLTARELDMLARWIDAGAQTIRPEPESLSTEDTFTEEERQHWAFQPIRRPVLPMTRQGRVALQAALSTLPVTRVDRERLVYREWDDERDWLVRMTNRAGVGRTIPTRSTR